MTKISKKGPKQPDLEAFEPVDPPEARPEASEPLFGAEALRGRPSLVPAVPVVPVVVAPVEVNLAGMEIDALLGLRGRIEALLPPTRLADLDLEAEILLQYHQTKAMLAKVSVDVGVPANQKAQVANSCAAVLEQLIKMQTRLYSAERIKAIETALIKTLKTLEPGVQAQFFEDYERAYSQAASGA